MLLKFGTPCLPSVSPILFVEQPTQLSRYTMFHPPSVHSFHSAGTCRLGLHTDTLRHNKQRLPTTQHSGSQVHQKSHKTRDFISTHRNGRSPSGSFESSPPERPLLHCIAVQLYALAAARSAAGKRIVLKPAKIRTARDACPQPEPEQIDLRARCPSGNAERSWSAGGGGGVIGRCPV